MRAIQLCVVLGLVLMLATPALGGTVVTGTVQALEASVEPGDITMFLETDRMRIEFQTPDSRQRVQNGRDNDQECRHAGYRPGTLQPVEEF